MNVDGRKLEFFGWMSRIQWTNDGKTVVYAGERNGRSALMRQSLNGDLMEDPLNLDKDELLGIPLMAVAEIRLSLD